MPKLHQIIAVERDVKQSTNRRLADLHNSVRKVQLTSGLTRTYRAKDEDGEELPGETHLVQVRVADSIAAAKEQWERLWDAIATKDWGNTEANADVIVDGQTLISYAPATFLLWLEKQLDDIHKFVEELPVLDPAEKWTFSPEKNCYVTAGVETVRTKKVPFSFVKAEATDKHPAQVEVMHEDRAVGYWNLVKFSGALPESEVKAMLDRIQAVREAVKQARARANEIEVEQQKVAGRVLDYIFSVAPNGTPA